MHRLFAGLNVWSALLLTAAGWLGLAGSREHVRVAVLAGVFACLVQCGVIALFLGAAKLLKEHVGRFDLPLGLIDRLNEVYHRLFPTAAVGALLAAVASILGGAADLGRVPLWAHTLPATACWLYQLVCIPAEYRLQRRLSLLVGEMEGLLPPADQMPRAVPRPGYRPDEVKLDRPGRARALLYLGLTLPLPYLGYTFISGRDVSFLLLPTVVVTAACLGLALYERRRAGGAGR